jgi:uncharacterized protein with HEPN domain
MKDDLLYLGHIRDAILTIAEYTSEGREAFFHDKKTQDAVVRNIEVIGEAAKNMSDTLKSKYSHVAWREITGMRDKVIHDYAGVDLKLVWDVIENNLPSLLKTIEKMIEELG